MTDVYCSDSELMAELGIESVADQGSLDTAIDAASRQVDGYCGRSFWQDTEVVAREFYPQSAVCCDLLDQPGEEPAREISTTTGLIVKVDDGTGTFATTLTIGTHFLLHPRNAAADNIAFNEIHLVDSYTFTRPGNGRATVQITAKFGWPSIPARVKKATLIQAAQLYKSKDAVFGVAAFGEGGIMRLTSGLHRQAQTELARYQVVPIG